jgi:hypothetical protein
MFDFKGVTRIIQYPTKRFGYVGSVPPVLGDVVKATTADIMGGRAFTCPDGTAGTMKFPSFETEAEARTFAASKGVTVR